MKKIVFLIALMAIVQASFAQSSRNIYTNPIFNEIAGDHKELAILPFQVTMNLRPRQMEKFTPEEFEDLQLREGLAVQSALHSYFLKRKSKKDFEVNFQDISRTNALLAQNGINHTNVATYTMEQLSEILGVDGIVSGTMVTSKPMSEGASVALGLLVGYYGATNQGSISIKINDGESGELLWKYDKTLTRSLGSTTQTVIEAMMRKSSRKFPYNFLAKS